MRVNRPPLKKKNVERMSDKSPLKTFNIKKEEIVLLERGGKKKVPSKVCNNREAALEGWRGVDASL